MRKLFLFVMAAMCCVGVWANTEAQEMTEQGPHKAPTYGTPTIIPRVPVKLIKTEWSYSGYSSHFEFGYSDSKLLAKWDDFFNGEGKGSVLDYFITQSGGKFKPQFDVYIPGSGGIKDKTIYDANGDGVMDFVIYIYSSYARTKYSDAPTEGANFVYSEGDGVECDKMFKFYDHYTSYNEEFAEVCRAFSHAMGLPDYSVEMTSPANTYATPHKWSLMDHDNNLSTPNYSIFDKFYMGWDTPEVLKLGETVTIKPSQSGYVVTRDGKMPAYNHPDTVYYLENRQQTDWDDATPGHGLLIWQVIFNQEDWKNNTVNKTVRRKVLVPAAGDPKNFVSGGDKDYDTYPGPDWRPKTTVKQLFNYTLYNISEDSEGNVTFSTDLFASSSSLTAKLISDKDKDYSPDPIENAHITNYVQLKVDISGNVAGNFELQCMRHFADGSKDADYISCNKCWSVSKAEAIKGYEWKTDERLISYLNCLEVDFRIKGTAIVDGKKKEFYSNVIPVQIRKFTLSFYPGDIQTEHIYGETNIKIAEHTNDCATYDVQCEQEAKVSVIDGWVVLEKMPCANVKIYTQTDNLKYYVYFLDYDGSTLKTQLVSCGEDATPPANPSYKGMEFIKWNGNYTNVHGTSYVYAQYEAGTGEFVNIEMTEHTCIDLQPFTGKDYRDEVFAGNDQIALTGDHLTFRFTQESNYGGTVNFWWTQTFDSETNEPDFSSSVKTKVGTLTAEQAKARQDMFYTYDICNTSACVDEKTFVEKMAFKFVYNSNGTNYESKPMIFYIYYPLIFRFKKDDGIKGLLKVYGFNTFTNNMSQLTERGDYVYTWIPARSQENVFYKFTNTSFQDINDCVTMSRLRYPKTWGEVSTDVDWSGNPYIIQMGFIDTIAVSKQSFHVEFRYRIKYEDETGYKPVKDEQTVACGEAAVEPSHEDMYLPFAGWFLNGKIDEESRWLNVTEDMYFQADYVYPPDPVYYTVTFVDKEGNVIGKPEEVLEFENAHPPIESIPKFEGWHFIRWEGSYINITSDRTIQAIYGQDDVYWKVNYYNWDDEWLGKEIVQDGHAATMDSIYPYKTGHRFTGWDMPLNDVRKDMKVTALFDAVETPTYKVTVVAENGSVKAKPNGVDLDHVTEMAIIQLEPVPDENYEFECFEGYNTESGLIVTKDTTVTAFFALKKFTVLFLDWNDDLLFTEIVEYGKDAKGPDTKPTREGYKFTGWSKPLTNITGDMIVIALYEQNPPTGIDNMEQPMLVGQKMLRDGRLYIVVGDRIYDATGKKVQ